MHWTDTSLTQLKDFYIEHRIWKRVMALLESQVLFARPGEAVLLVGPSRVGKSRIVSKMLRKTFREYVGRQSDIVPYIYISASNRYRNGRFSTRTLKTRGLEALRHPFFGAFSPEDKWGMQAVKLVESTSESQLQAAFENALRLRQCQFLVIDEAQHLMYADKSGVSASGILDSLKCLSEDANVILLVVGSYPLLDVASQSAHFSGRKFTIHFPRYLTVEHDIHEFNAILDAYSEQLRLPPDIDSLRDWNDMIYKETYGITGLVDHWIRAALPACRAADEKYLTKNILLRTRKLAIDKEIISTEIAIGEKYWEEIESESEFSDSSVPISNSGGHAQRKTKRKPFARKPKRFKLKERMT